MRLPGCEKWHPGEPSEIAMWRDHGYKRPNRPVCKVCVRLRRKSHESKLTIKKPTYNLLPALNWKPPEVA